MVNDQSAKESSPIGPNRIADALLTSDVDSPGEVHRRLDPPPGARLGGQIDRGDRVHPPAVGPDQPDGLLGRLRVQVTAHHVGALPRAE